MYWAQPYQFVDDFLDPVSRDWAISAFLFKFLTLTNCQNLERETERKMLTLANLLRLSTEIS